MKILLNTEGENFNKEISNFFILKDFMKKNHIYSEIWQGKSISLSTVMSCLMSYKDIFTDEEVRECRTFWAFLSDLSHQNDWGILRSFCTQEFNIFDSMLRHRNLK